MVVTFYSSESKHCYGDRSALPILPQESGRDYSFTQQKKSNGLTSTTTMERRQMDMTVVKSSSKMQHTRGRHY